MKCLCLRGLGAVCLVAWMAGAASAQYTADGFITSWLVLGEYLQPDGAAPAVSDMEEDYLADGAGTLESTIQPVAGQEVMTSYGNAAYSLGLSPNLLRGDADGDGYPEWIAWYADTGGNGNIDFNVIYGDVDNVMAYGCVYVYNDTGGGLDVDIACGSDDGIQVYVNEDPLWTNSIARSFGGGLPQDRFAAYLEEGLNRILVKVFEGDGGHNFSLRIEEQGTMRPLMFDDELYPLLDPAGALFGIRNIPDVAPTSPELVEIFVFSLGTVSGQVEVVEQPPLGWEVSNISAGGALQPDGSIRWTFAATELPEDLSYSVTSLVEDAPGLFSGTMQGTVGGKALSAPIGGETMIAAGPMGPTSLGYIKGWLILGEYAQSGGDSPPPAVMERDYLTDGVVHEALLLPSAGEEVETDYCGLSASSGLSATAIAGDLDGNGYPEWFEWVDPDEQIDYSAIFGDDGVNLVDNVMTYACTYVINPTDAPIDCYFGASSDDSLEVYINTDPVWVISIPRGWAGVGADQDTVPVTIQPGKNRILVKCFEGGGGHGIVFRLKDAQGNGVLLPVTLDPTGCVIPEFGVSRKLPTVARLRGEMEVLLEGVGTGSGQVTIRETVPAGWEIVDAGGGTQNGQTLTWARSAGDIGTIQYTVKAPGAKFGAARFRGTYTPAGGVDLGIFGDRTVGDGAPAPTTGAAIGDSTQSPIGTDGYLRNWLVLGPILRSEQNCPAASDADLQADHLIDADAIVIQEEIWPYEGMIMDIDFGGMSRGAGWGETAKTGLPAWLAYYDGDGAINYNDELFPPDPDYVMAYAICYITNTSGADMEVYFGTGSDDMLEVWFDDAIVKTVNLCRGWDWGNPPQDVLGPVIIPDDGFQHRIMTKAFEQGGGWGFYLRLQDAGGVAITTGFDISLEPETGGAPSIGALRTLDPIYAPGATFPVTIDVSVSGAAVRVDEIVPDDWTISNITAGGARTGQEIVWDNVVDGARLSYDVTPPAGTDPGVWMGSISQSGAGIAIFGDSRSVAETPPLSEDDVSPWRAKDVGAALTGGIELLGGDGTPGSPMDVDVWGSGTDIWGTADAFRFVYVEREGSFRITAEVPSFEYTNDWAKAGVMVRTSPCPSAMYAFAHVTPAVGTINGNDFQYRLVEGADAGLTGPTAAGTLVNWVRIERFGATMTAYLSSDGDTWTLYGTQTLSGATGPVLVGLAVSSHDADLISRAEFRNVVLEDIEVCPTDVNATCNGTDVVLTWTNTYTYNRIRIRRVDTAGTAKLMALLAASAETWTDTTAAAMAPGVLTYRVIPVVGSSEVLSCGECQDTPAPCDGTQVCLNWPACTTASCGCTCGGGGETRFIRGDTDGNGQFTIGDGVQILERLFSVPQRPAFGSNCEKTGDFDDTGALTIGDAIGVFNLLFAFGRDPEPPYPACGEDPTPDGLSCDGPVPACP
ncbi:MAG: hypothetical protein JXP34_11920 [Planctomycetes bacterium]|nr:hypothetical protein [Planctomycetota bacterium]